MACPGRKCTTVTLMAVSGKSGTTCQKNSHGFLFQHYDQFASDVDAFLSWRKQMPSDDPMPSNVDGAHPAHFFPASRGQWSNFRAHHP